MYKQPVKRNILYLFIIILAFNACDTTNEDSPYPRQVGDITFDKKLDNPDFEICNEARAQQYYSFRQTPFYGEKTYALDYFNDNYSSEGLESENGYLTIRFIVNCKGQSGRFRMQELDLNLNEQKFNPLLSEQLMQLTKGIKKWNIQQSKDTVYDYYYYLTFKIMDGEINELLP